MKRTLLALLLALPLLLWGKVDGYKLVFQIEGNQDTSLYMGCYYANQYMFLDTALNDGKGKFIFKGSRELRPGLYFLTNNKSRFMEFVVYHEAPTFQFRTLDTNWVANMQVKGSRQNEVFFNYKRASQQLYDEMVAARGTMDSASYVDFRRRQGQRMDSLNRVLHEQRPESMIAKMLYATKRVEDEVPHLKPDGSVMSKYERYDYFMSHYFDYMPVDDDFILRTPKNIFYQHVTDYTDKYMRGMPPGEICPLLDSLIDRAEPAPDVYRWLLIHLTDKFLQSNVMVYDEVYVHLVQRYFATGKVTGLSTATIDEQIERAGKWQRLLVGREAPELVLFDTMRIARSLRRMPGRYTLLLFWSPTCGHCREIVPALYEAFKEVADSLDMSAFAILTEPDDGTVTKWKKFLAEHGMDSPRWFNMSGGEANVDWREVYDIHTTPQVYLIENERHTFVAKKLNAKIFREVCRQLK